VTERATRHVHLFHGNELVATLVTEDKTPAESYVHDGVRYRCISYMEITEQTGVRGFDVQVEILGD
jgi:hypothetical protein